MKLEFKRNRERYQFLKWGMQAFDTFKVVPPGIGIVHQVNLEYLARGVHQKDGVYYPDTLVGTDSHTTMINGIGVVGWGVGGIEAEAGMLGQPVYFLTPDVVGVHLTGTLRDGVHRDRPRAHRHRDAAQGARWSASSSSSSARARLAAGHRPRDDRQHGARVRRDHGLLPGRRQDHRRTSAAPAAPTRRSTRSRPTSRRRACSACPKAARSTTPRTLELDLSAVMALASPARSARRIASSSAT